MSTITVTLIPEDFEISPALSGLGYEIGQLAEATTEAPEGYQEQSLSGSGTLFVGGHPIKGRNG